MVKKKDLVKRATDILHEKDVRKTIPAIKTKLRIMDEEGNESHFTVKAEQKGYLLNESDVSAVLDALMQTVTEALRSGDEIVLYGFGTLGPHRRAARRMKMVDGTGYREIAEHLVPKFAPGKYLRMALKMYEAQIKEDAVPDAFSGLDDEDGD